MTREPRRRAVERLDRAQSDQLGHPARSQLGDVGGRVAGEGGEQFLVRGDPGDLLDPDPDAGVQPLEFGHELGDDLALASHRPEAQRLAAVVRAPPQPASSGEPTPARTVRRRGSHAAEPAAGKARPLEPAAEMRIAAHHLPDEAAAVILDHRQDRALVDAEIVGVVPALARHDPAVDAGRTDVSVKLGLSASRKPYRP